MSALDDFKLYFESYPFETKELLVNSAKRASKVRTQQLLKRAEKAAKTVVAWRLFKRLRMLEDKIEKPFIHDSGLTQYIDDAIAARLKARKPRAAKGKAK